MVLLASLLISCSQESFNKENEIENIRTFAKLYGYVRFFHPSDRASAVDWDRFAICGVKSLKNATTQKELRKALEDLFYPIAPTI